MDNAQMIMHSVPPNAPWPSAVGVAALRRPDSPTPSLLRSRISEVGSIFHEAVWPPPASPGMMDPIRMSSSQVDLGTIVDEVMGPTSSASNKPLQGHRRDISTATSDSSMPLLGFGHISSVSEDYQLPPSPASSVSHPLPPSLHTEQVIDNAPVSLISQNPSHTQSSTSTSSMGIGHPFPSSAEPPLSPLVMPSSRPLSSLSMSGSISSSVTNVNRTQPKVSSPLSRVLSGFSK